MPDKTGQVFLSESCSLLPPKKTQNRPDCIPSIKFFRICIGKISNIFNDRFQIFGFCQNRHLCGFSVTFSTHSRTATKIKCKCNISHFSQKSRIMFHTVLPCHKSVTYDCNRKMISFWTVDCSTNRQSISFAFKSAFCNSI